MADIFEEVSKEVQQEKLKRLWKENQKAISTVLTCIIVAVAIFAYWQYRQQEIREEASSDYTDSMFLLTMGHPDRALKSLEVIPQKSGHTYADLSKLLGAGIMTDKGDIQGAIDSYESLLQTSSNQEFKNLALLKLLYLQSQMLPAAEIIEKLQPLLTKGNPWYYLAKELEGTLFYQQGEIDKAAAVFQELTADKDLPAPQRLRLQLLRSNFLYKTQKQ